VAETALSLRGNFMKVTILKTKVKVDLLLTLIIITGVIAGQVREILAILLSITVHEAAHVVIADGLGLKIEEIVIMPFGGKIKLNLIDEERIQSGILITLAGPMANFLVSLLMLLAVYNEIVPTEFGYILVDYQIKLGLFNLLPALPLDGGRIFSLWLMRHMSFIDSIRVASRIGKIVGIIIACIGVCGLVFDRGFYLFPIMGIFLYLQSMKEEGEAPLSFMKYVSGKKGTFIKKGFFYVEQIIAVQDLKVNKILSLFLPHKYYIVCVVDKEMNIIKYLTETEIFDKIINKGLDIRIKDLI
jgi:stage IV sporulation protein FB